MRTAIIMFMVWNSALIVRRVVKLPGPAISGKTTGKSVEELSADGLSFLKISTPNIISIEIISNTTAPATANEEIST